MLVHSVTLAVIAGCVLTSVAPTNRGTEQEGPALEQRPLFGPFGDTSAQAREDMNQWTQVLLDSSSDLAEVQERTKGLSDLSAIDAAEMASLGKLFYPTVDPVAQEARARLLAMGPKAVPVIVNALGDLDLETYAGRLRAEFAKQLLGEIALGQLALDYGDTARYYERITLAWGSLWKRALSEPEFLKELMNPGTGESRTTFAREGDALILGEGPLAIPFVKAELAMQPGMKISATTSSGTMTICADEGFGRFYSWEGATRFAVLDPRPKRWYGSLGIYCGGFGDHWEEHNGITRGVLQEGQMHFNDIAAARAWLDGRTWMPHVHRNDGLVVGWTKNPSRDQLNVNVWQIYVDGHKPTELPGSSDENLVIEPR